MGAYHEPYGAALPDCGSDVSFNLSKLSFLVLPHVLPLPGSLHLEAVGRQDGYLARSSPFLRPQGLYTTISPS
jgi:hypothetical protein